MINKDESIEIFFKYYDEFSENERAEQMYDAIKYSIGTCGECRHCKYNFNEQFYWCNIKDIPTDEDDGCLKWFERKE